MNSSTLSLGEVQAFLAVAESGGFGSAGLLLGLSQSTVSRRVAALERRIGQRLVARTTRHVSLTEPGRQYAAEVRDLIAQFEHAHARLQNRQSEPQGLLRITMPSAYGAVRVAPRIAGLVQRYPRLSFELDFSDHYVDLLDGQFDVAIRLRPAVQSGVQSEKLGDTRLLLCAAPAYLDGHGLPASVDALREHVWLAFRTDAPRLTWPVAFEDRNITLDIAPTLTANDTRTLMQLVEQGAGLAILPDYLCEAGLENGRLVQVLPSMRLPRREVFVAFPQHVRHLTKVQVLLQALRETT